jgi:hypothetical protein
MTRRGRGWVRLFDHLRLIGIAKVSVAVFLSIALVGSVAFGGARYFPTGTLGDDSELVERWYSEQLTALKEKPLCCGLTDSATTVRFTWLRSFHHPVAIRLSRSGDGRWLLTTKAAAGAGGYKPGHLATNVTRELKASDAEQILSLVAPATTYCVNRRAKLTSRGCGQELGLPGGSSCIHTTTGSVRSISISS